MKWVEEKPSEPGWYWHEDNRHVTCPVNVFVSPEGNLVVTGFGLVVDLKGKWSERLVAPVKEE